MATAVNIKTFLMHIVLPLPHFQRLGGGGILPSPAIGVMLCPRCPNVVVDMGVALKIFRAHPMHPLISKPGSTPGLGKTNGIASLLLSSNSVSEI